MVTDPTVLIVGAGPTGLTAALALARSGIPCRILDKRTSASSSSRALGLQARSMEVLAGLGVTEEIEQAAYRLHGSSIRRGLRTVVEMAWVRPSSRFPYTYVLPQSGLEEILRDRLEHEGVEVERGAEVLHVEESEPGARARLAGGEEITAPWVIGADGARSSVRTSLGIGFPERATGEAYHLADAVLDLPAELGDAAMWLGPEGPLMLMRLPSREGLWRVFVDISDAVHETEPTALDAPALSRLLETRGPGGVTVHDLRWVSVFRTRIGLADSYRRGRVVLAGDAAHVFPPFGGQGMNLGIQDAVAAAWRIASIERGAGEDLMASYQRERRPVAERVISDVDARRRMFALRNPAARAGRDLLLALGGRSRRAARSASEQNSQLSISYAARTRGGRRLPRPRPGDRAPHAELAGTTTHELFGPDHATLLLFRENTAGGEAAVGSGRTVAPASSPHLSVVPVTRDDDPEGQTRARYGVGPGKSAWVLVRPDGHIAGRGTDLVEARRQVTELMGA